MRQPSTLACYHPRMITDVHHVGIAVSELSVALAFYHEALGLPIVKQGDMPARGVRVAMLAAGRSYLEKIGRAHV